MSRYVERQNRGALCLLSALVVLCVRSKEGATVERHARASDDELCCSENLTVSSTGGTLTSPNYPSPYPGSVECRWLLSAAHPKATLLLNIVDLSLEPDTTCRLDFLQVYLGPTPLAPSLGPFCGSLSNRLLQTNTSTLLLLFRSDPAYEDRGFKIEYFMQSSTECPSLLTEPSGTLHSPGFPTRYPDRTDCWTLISVGEGRRVSLSFDTVDMEYGDNCTFDYVRILDGEASNSTVLGQICRQSDQRRFESTSGFLLVHFHSDNSVSKSGYKATYTALDPRSTPTGNCLWKQEGSGGTVASPGYPSNYPSSSNCSLWILAPEGSKVLLHLDALQLEIDPQCTFDFLLIEEPTKEGDRVLGKLCGNDGEPKNLTSSGNEVHLLFKSDDFGEFSGFKLRYSFFSPGAKNVSTNTPAPELAFSVVPSNVTLATGSSHTLRCVTPHPEATLKWLKGDTVLTGDSSLTGLKLLPNHTLWIQSMDHRLSGIYTCVASTPEKNITASAYVLVRPPENETCNIVFRKTPSDSWFAPGEFAHLECQAVGAQVRVSWQKDGRPLESGGRVTVLRNGYMLVERVEVSDSGVYVCVAHDFTEGCEKRASALLQVSSSVKIEEICGIPRASQPSSDIPRDNHGKITGGHDAKKGAHPWQAMLWEPNLEAFCGGTLLNERWVSTAAHCFVNYRNLRWDRVVIKLGKHDREREEEHEFRTGIADSSSIIVHPAYNRLTFDNDLALIRLRDHVPFNDHILPACLGDRALGEELLQGQDLRTGTVIGWGKLKYNGAVPRFLQEIVLPVVNQQACIRSTNYTVTRNMFCAGYTQEVLGDACHGDSGGPFLMQHSGRWHLVGVVSWGEGCGSANKYGFYTRVPNYLSWIQGIIKS